MTRIALLLAGLVGLSQLHAQSVGISASGSQPDASAMLDVASSTSGLLVPQVTTAQRNAIAMPATGLLIFHAPLQRYEYFDGTLWRPLLQEGRAWGLTGNGATNATTNFLGTTDAQDLVLRTNGTERARLTAANGRLGLGTNTPAEALDVQGRIRMVDGTEGNGKVLTSDANGNSSWTDRPGPIYYRAFNTENPDIYYFIGGYYPMPGMQVDLVPRDSILIVHFSGAGSQSGSSLCSSTDAHFQLVVNGSVQVTFLETKRDGMWQAGYTHPVHVTPGVDTRIAIHWYMPGCELTFQNWGMGLNRWTSFRELVVIDPNTLGQASYTGPPSSGPGWSTTGNAGTDPAVDFIGTNDARDLVFRTIGLERMRLTASGNLGIGTSTPTARMHVRGSFALLNGTQAAGRVLTSDALGNATWSPMETVAWGLTGNTGTNAATHYVGTGDLQPFVLRTDAQERVRVSATGLVGIGTDVPGGRLTLSRPAEAATEQLEVRNVGGITDGNYDGLRWTQGAAGGTTLGNVRVHYHSNGTTDLSLGTRFDTQALFIEHGGQVGIGTTTPDRHLEVSGTGTQYARVTSTSGGIVGMEFLRTGAGLDWHMRNDAGLLFFGQSNDDLATVNDVLRLGGGSVTPAVDNAFPLGTATLRWTQVFAVNGAIQTSDRRLKTDIRPLDDGLDAVRRLRPVNYRWKREANASKRPGLLAQEVRKVLPEVVVGGRHQGPLGMNYSELVPVLTDAVRQLFERLEHLEEERERLLLRLESIQMGGQVRAPGTPASL